MPAVPSPPTESSSTATPTARWCNPRPPRTPTSGCPAGRLPPRAGVSRSPAPASPASNTAPTSRGGALLTADGDGKAVTAADGNRVIGIAEVSGVAGDIGQVLLAPGLH